jgi:SsrA-binding protein
VKKQAAASRAGAPAGARGGARLLVAANKKARHDYAVGDTFEAGLVLTGTEVKSLRQGRANLVDAYATVRQGEAWLIGAHIPEYTQGTWTNHEPRRTRKLLLHKHELAELEQETTQGGKTLVPLQLYFFDGVAKVELGLAVGKKSYDKRHDLAERDARREINKEMGRRAKGMR